MSFDRVVRIIFILNLVWERHVVRLWRQCLVTWICTYTWTSRWRFFCLQWVSFAAMPSRTSDLLIVLFVGSMSVGFLPFRSWIVIGLSSSLLLVFGLYTIYILHCIIYIYKTLLILFFSHDLVLVFIAKAFSFSSVIFKSYSHLSSSRQKQCRGSHKAWM